jgi:hypothetical protein
MVTPPGRGPGASEEFALDPAELGLRHDSPSLATAHVNGDR